MCPHPTSLNAGLAFGAGPYRCPGRFFAEMEVALLLQLILHTYDMQLVATETPHLTSSTACPCTPPCMSTLDARPHNSSTAIHSSKRKVEAEPAGNVDTDPPGSCPVKAAGPRASLLQQLCSIAGGQEWLSYGLGIFNFTRSSSGQEEQHTGLHDWRLSGDPAALLPACDLIRLVGIKHPATMCRVSVRLRKG